VSGAPLLFPNLGAEEGESWQRMARHPRVRALARLWAALFPAGARFALEGAPTPPTLAGRLATDSARAALELCDVGPGFVPWLATDEAFARAAGHDWCAALPECVARVHDKAFALEFARAHSMEPAPLAGRAFALAPKELVDPDTAACRIEERVASWPEALRARFVLKPRHGTSGRGRLEGREGELERDALRGAAPRLRARGGCVVEPWLERTSDLSAQLWVRGAADVLVLGTLSPVVTLRGVPVGHTGFVAADGSVQSGCAWDAELRRAALALARAAAAAGYRGPCGVDAFAYRDTAGVEHFRPIVELNARFTAGTVALGLLARARRADLCARGTAFYLGFAPDEHALSFAPSGCRRLELLTDQSETALWLADDERALESLTRTPVPR
jgi:hypothetical protein